MTESQRERSLSFGSEAAAYERGRPSYPPDAIDWLLPPGARDVLDLGAGTGKLTTRLVERGLDVVAVDPLAEMLELLRSALPDTPALLGTAEQIPLAGNSVTRACSHRPRMTGQPPGIIPGARPRPRSLHTCMSLYQSMVNAMWRPEGDHSGPRGTEW